MPMNRMDSILLYWFEGIDDSALIKTKELPFRKWFVNDKNVDSEIQSQFEPDLLKASEGAYKSWEDTSKGRLVLIILLDQFSRNIYRDTEKMYAFDPLALVLTLRTLKEGKDKELLLIHRAFLYLPLMHSENIKMQQLSIKHYRELVEKSRDKNKNYYENTLKYAQEHHKTVAQFGRFPHRDVILKRTVQ